MIEVEGLTKDYGPRRAINNLTFQANSGEILGFLGPNGAGKSRLTVCDWDRILSTGEF